MPIVVKLFLHALRAWGELILFDSPGSRARTAAYFSLVGKVGKSTPKPTVLDSLLSPAEAGLRRGICQTLGGGEELRCHVNKKSYGHLIFALAVDQLRLTPF